MSSTWAVPSYGEQWAVPGYTEERDLGRGASGRVVQAVQDSSGRRVAIKYLSPALFGDPAYMWGFRSEAQILRELDVPQVVQVYDYVEQPGTGAAIVMELVVGVSLHQMIERRGPTGPEAALTVLKGSLLGLAAAHTLGIVHQDYKPENVLIDTAGNSKLADFGVAVRWGKQAPTAGTPLYMAPEQWHGAPASPATDVYAAAAVFYECLTGRTPFSGKLFELQEQHVTAAVALDKIDPPLQNLIARGMAKNPAGRPQSAIAFVSELEALAAAAYGPDWEERGRRHLAERAAALLPLLLRERRPGASGRSYAATWEGGRSRGRLITITAAAAAVVLILGAAATALVLRSNSSQDGLLGDSSTSQTVTTNELSFDAVADVTPPVVTSTCAAATTFTYTATLSATAPGTMKYQWVYSTGKSGPVQTLAFTAAGKKAVSGGTVAVKTASTGWAEIKMISPTAKILDKASYQLLCGSTAVLGANAWIPVAPGTGVCGQPVQAFTAAGSIWDTKPGTVTYYWALSDGVDSALQTLTFPKAETLDVASVALDPLAEPGSGSAVLVVTSPAAASSSPATYTLSCTVPKPVATTASPTPTKSASPSPTPSATSPSPTPSASASPTATTASPTPTPTPTTASPTPTPTPTTSSPTATPATTAPTVTPTTASPTTASPTTAAPVSLSPAPTIASESPAAPATLPSTILSIF